MKDIKYRREVKWWALAHEWYRDVIKVVRESTSFGRDGTGEDFRQEDWFRVGGDQLGVRWGGGEGAKTGDFYRLADIKPGL